MRRSQPLTSASVARASTAWAARSVSERRMMPRVYSAPQGPCKEVRPRRLRRVLLAQSLELFVRDVGERLHAARIELRPSAARDLQAGLRERGRVAVRPVAGHRVERVGDGEDARAQRDGFSTEAVRLS